MGRREPNGFRIHITLLIAVALAACTSATGSDAPTDVPPTSATASTSDTPSSSPAERSDEEAVAAVWESLHSLRIEQTYSQEEFDGSVVAGLTTEELGSSLVALVEARRGDIPLVSTAAEFWPEVAVAANGSQATISDCILVATRPVAEPDAEPTVRSTVWSGSAAETSDGWVLDDVTLGQDNCVPAELNGQLLAAYEGWHEAANGWWDPPNPDHELLSKHMVDPGLQDMRNLLADHRDMGIAVRDRHTLENAVVFDLGIGSARIVDCFPAHPDSAAAFDVETGERRTELSPEPTPGQVDRTVLDLERVANETWKANGWRSVTDSDCVPGESHHVVAP